MTMQYPEWINVNVLVMVGLFSMGWFLVGILAGRAMNARKNGGSSRKAPRFEAGRSSGNGGDNGLIEMYVGNLSYEMGDRNLVEEFKRFGQVASARIIKNRFNGKSKGFGFVEMADRTEAQAAIRALNGKEILGRKIVVNEAKSQSRN
jgi:cold-inducible RNA-binding protein